MGKIGLKTVSKNLLKAVAGIVILAALLYGPDVYGNLTAVGRLSEEAQRALSEGGAQSVTVELVEDAESFHRTALNDAGTYAGRVGPSVVRLVDVSPDGLRWLSRQPWVVAISVP